MLLTATTDRIEVVLGANVTTNQLHLISSYNDTNSTSVTPTKTVTVTNNTTAVNLVPAPSSGQQRTLRWASIFNSDSTDATVTIRTNFNGTTRTVFTTNLKVNEYIQYTYKTGWKVYDQNGALKLFTNYVQPTDNLTGVHGLNLTNGSLTLATTGTAYCTYMGKATSNHKSMFVQLRFGQNLGTPTWAEVAVYKGKFTIGTATTFTRLGFADVTNSWTGTNATKWAQIPLTNCQAGDDLWFVIGNSAVTSLGVRSLSVPDGIGAGFFQTSGSCRPSTNSTFTGTIDSTTTPLNIAWTAFI